MYKVDLHTHSVGSPDGGLTAQDYRQMLASEKLHSIAVTDHNTIDFAQKLHKQLGNQIIIGEEITTAEGELIGLYLTEVVPAGLSALETAEKIHAQGGLVYVPHPFETVRKGLPLHVLEQIGKEVDIVETRNGRAVFQNRSVEAKAWAAKHKKSGAASSDTHGRSGWSKTYSLVAEVPTRESLVGLLHEGEYEFAAPGLRGVLYPKVNRLKKKLRRA